jgi:20S proteasome subunit alpha 6
MRSEALNNKYVYGTPIQAGRLVADLADMHQLCTQSYVRRPYGVGLLVAAYDQTGPHLYVTEPSGNYLEYFAMAIGSRSQTSRTYLEKYFDEFSNSDLDGLIKHAVKALAASLSNDSELDLKSAAVAIVGKNTPFEFIEGERLQRYLDEITTEQENQPVDTAMELENPTL